VRYEVEAGETLECEECNCSICAKSGYLHLIVPKSRFHLLAGEEYLTTYTFNTGVAQHFFCRACGVKPFYIPRSNPDGYDINVRTLDTVPAHIEIEPFDGRNWEQHAHKLADKSRETSRS